MAGIVLVPRCCPSMNFTNFVAQATTDYVTTQFDPNNEESLILMRTCSFPVEERRGLWFLMGDSCILVRCDCLRMIGFLIPNRVFVVFASKVELANILEVDEGDNENEIEQDGLLENGHGDLLDGDHQNGINGNGFA